jgi:hypothetical protein
MLRFVGRGIRLCDGLSRREVLRVGGLGIFGSGLSLADLSARGAPEQPADRSFGRAKSCIVLFLIGGPPQHSTWDPKPDAPAQIRGDFGPIATNVPGISICELLPRSAQVADRLCILRAVTTGDNSHSSSGYYMLTGRPHQPMNFENANPGPPNDAPCLGALVSGWGHARGVLPEAITLPQKFMNTNGSVWPGQDAGFRGRAANFWLLNSAWGGASFHSLDIELPEELDTGRMGRRRDLLERLAPQLDMIDRDVSARRFDARTRQALDLLRTPAARRAFRLDLEPQRTHDRYGRTPFGQGVLMARRLVEAGVRLVQVNWYRGPNEPRVNPVWDSHAGEAGRLKEALAPPADQAISALVEDLDQRGLLDETLVVCMGEFGRTPRLDSNGGRSHWGSVFSIALAGGGIQGGEVYGSSDRIGAFPRENRVRPEDLSATMLHCLGLNPSTEITDVLGRPYPLSRGEVLRAIL